MKHLALIVVLLFAVAACSPSDEVAEQIIEEGLGDNAEVEISGDGDDVTVNVETDDGSFAIGSDVDLPDELSIPVPAGGEVGTAGTTGGSAFASITYAGDRYDEIVAFYDAWTTDTGEEWQTQTAEVDLNGQLQRSASWSNADLTSFIAVADCGTTETLNMACVTINQG